MQSIPVKWAPVIAAAWLNDEFKKLLENEPIKAFAQFGLTYEGSEPFVVPAAPPKQDISILREMAKQEVVVSHFVQQRSRLYLELKTEQPEAVKVYFEGPFGEVFFEDEFDASQTTKKAYDLSLLPKGTYRSWAVIDGQTYEQKLVIE